MCFFQVHFVQFYPLVQKENNYTCSLSNLCFIDSFSSFCQRMAFQQHYKQLLLLVLMCFANVSSFVISTSPLISLKSSCTTVTINPCPLQISPSAPSLPTLVVSATTDMQDKAAKKVELEEAEELQMEMESSMEAMKMS